MIVAGDRLAKSPRSTMVITTLMCLVSLSRLFCSIQAAGHNQVLPQLYVEGAGDGMPSALASLASGGSSAEPNSTMPTMAITRPTTAEAT
jgi:hypothetical protein